MRAAVINAVDGPFELVELPDPSTDGGKVLVRVRAAGINFADVLVRRGRYPQMPELPAVLGSEIAGELEDGTRVMAITSGAGGYAELAAVDRAQVVPLPDHASFAEGASVTADELREFLAPQFAKWWLPERFEFVAEIPKTSVGKFRKTELREMFATEPSAVASS